MVLIFNTERGSMYLLELMVTNCNVEILSLPQLGQQGLIYRIEYNRKE
jgi:hypothetical protein